MTSRFRRPLGLKATLVGAVFLTVSATAAIVYLPWAITARRNINTIVAQVNQEMVVGTSKEVERLFTNAQSAQQLLSSSFGQDLIDLTDPDATRDFMLAVLRAYPNFTWVQYGDAGGDFLGAQRGPDQRIYFHQRIWDAASQTTTASPTTTRPSERPRTKSAVPNKATRATGRRKFPATSTHSQCPLPHCTSAAKSSAPETAATAIFRRTVTSLRITHFTPFPGNSPRITSSFNTPMKGRLRYRPAKSRP